MVPAIRSRARGFTLVELMIVVAIIGVLASLAIYGVSRYIRHAKTAEATRNLGTIEDGERVQYQQETPFGAAASGAGATTFVHMFCPTDGPVPPALPVGQKVKAPAGAYDTPGWRCMRFNLGDPQYYQYTEISNGASGTDAMYTAYAYGDLDGNTVLSTFYLIGAGGQLGDAVRQNFVVINEDE